MSALTMPVSERDHIRGAQDAPVTLVEYGDYECPYCGAAYPLLRELQDQAGDRLRFVFRNFPLTESHPFAEIAAEAAEAAGAQGSFWEMHNTLYENQEALDQRDLHHYAADLGLDLARFDRDLSEHHFAGRVREDFNSGLRSGVNGTPTFFINGQRFDEPATLENLLSAVQAAQERQHGMP